MLDLRQVKKLLKDLGHSDATSRVDALRMLKEYTRQQWDEAPNDAVESVTELLVRLSSKKAPALNGKAVTAFPRQEAVVVLGNIGPRARPAVSMLADMLEEKEPHAVREAAATALGKIGKDARSAVDALIAVLTPTCRITLAGRVARALGEIGCADQRVRNALVPLWLTPTQSDSFREQVGLALCKLRIEAPALLPTLTKTLVSPSHPSPRKAAAEALSWCDKKSSGVVAALLVALHDQDEELRGIAERGLERMDLTLGKAVQMCVDQLGDCIHAEVALRKTGGIAVAPLIKALKNSRSEVRARAANVLAALGEPAVEAAAALTRALQDDDPEVRLCAAKALWSVTKQPEAVVPTLHALLKNKKVAPNTDAEARRRFLQSVIEALGRMGPPAIAAVPVLTEKSRDENRLVRESAERALRLIKPIEAPKSTTVFA